MESKVMRTEYAVMRDAGEAEHVVDQLDALSSYQLAAMHWCFGMLDRLTGFAAALIVDDLEETAKEHLKAWRALAKRSRSWTKP
jgi:hypothetical protein